MEKRNFSTQNGIGVMRTAARRSGTNKSLVKVVLLAVVISLLSACDLSSGDEGFDNRSGVLDATGSAPSSSISSVENPGNDQLNSDQQLMLGLINAARSESRVCGQFGLMPAVGSVSWNSLLETSASNTVDDMASGDYFSHVNPLTRENGASRISSVGYEYTRWGENLDAGYSTPQAALEALLASDTHCRILMRPYWTEVAWFRRATPVHSIYDTMGAQHFGVPK